MASSIIKMASLASVAIVGAAASFSTVAEERLTVAWYGGNWGDAFKACVADPFTKATGVTVVPEVGTSTTTLAKLQQQKDAVKIDVAWMDGGISELAQAAGVLDSITAPGVANIANVVPQAIYKQGDATYAVGTGYYALGLTYNTKKITQPPTSWKDLWTKEYAGAVTIPSPSNSAGVPWIFFLTKVWGGDTKDLAPVFKEIKALDVALFFDSSGAASNAYQSGEAIIGAHFSVGAWDLIDKGLPIGYVVPKEGAWATDARLHLVKGTPNKASAEKFINTALTPEASSCLAEKLYLGPSVKGVKVSEATGRKLPWGVNGTVADLTLFDWNVINAQRPQITETWNREIAVKR